MSDLHQDLLDLAEEVRAVLQDLAERGVAAEDPEAPLPEPIGLEAEEQVPAEQAKLPEEPAVAEWVALAASSRAASRPSHLGDGVGAEGLELIRRELGDCARCRLAKGRTRIVFGLGDPSADLLVISQSPDTHEDEQGAPFVGEVGDMLDKMLVHVVGVSRDRAYVTNVVKCRPPSDRLPRSDETATCATFLERQIAAVRPKLLLLFGPTPLEQLLGLKSIERHLGQELVYRDPIGEVDIPAIATFHPRYLMRAPQHKRKAFDDLKLAGRRYKELGGR